MPDMAELSMQASTHLEVISSMESAVRYYCRNTPIVFQRGSGSEIFDEHGVRYIDFLSGVGSLNYGHNDPHIKQAMLDYLQGDGILQTLDFATTAKADFLRKFNQIILAPRKLDYKVQFTGPTGTNAVEAAIKLARKVTGRQNIVAFTNAYHGLSLGALALTGNAFRRAAAGVSLDNVIRLPYEAYANGPADSAAYAATLFADPSSGYDAPAAFIVETVQGEGGLNCASAQWLQSIEKLAHALGALFIVDDIQAGCGRTGPFFSFEALGIYPDLVCLSKSISGCGLPMALILIRPQHDLWQPGEHNGTFRGNNLAYVAATAVFDYWKNPAFIASIGERSGVLNRTLQHLAKDYFPTQAQVVGRGMFIGLRFTDPAQAQRLRSELLKLRVLAETSGPRDEVLKLMPPINIPHDILLEGLQALQNAAGKIAS